MPPDTTVCSSKCRAEDVDVETILVSRKVSGRFRCGKLLRHFSPNVSGLGSTSYVRKKSKTFPTLFCLNVLTWKIGLPCCSVLQVTLCLTACKPAPYFWKLSAAKTTLRKCKCYSIPQQYQISYKLNNQMDSSILPAILRIAMTWCYSLNRTRIKLLGK